MNENTKIITLSKNDKIILNNGISKVINELKIGDKLINKNNTGNSILSIETGISTMYKISKNKGITYHIDENTMLKLKLTNYEGIFYDTTLNRYRLRYVENYIIKEKSFPINKMDKDEKMKEIKTYLKNLKEDTNNKINNFGDIVNIKPTQYINFNNNQKKLFYNYTDYIDFESNILNINCYLIGLWLGDGDTENNRITTADVEIVEFLKNETKNMNLILKKFGDYQYNLSSKTGGKRSNMFRNFLRDNNMLGNKHIPDIIKYNSKEIRLQLLAGIIDSDGYYRNGMYEICLKLKNLCEDIIFIARSLNFNVNSLKETKKVCTNSVDKIPRTYYRFIISGHNIDEIPVLLPRKKATLRISKKNPNTKTITVSKIDNIEYIKIILEKNEDIYLEDFTIL